MATDRHVRLVYPHQLFSDHLDARHPDDAAETIFVLVEHDLLLRQYRFHSHKLVLHRASMQRFAARLREAGHDVEVVTSDGRTTSRAATARLLQRLAPTSVSVYDVVDDWLAQDITAALADVGHELMPREVLDSPNFLTTRADLAGYFDSAGGRGARMQHFYSWQRRRLDVLVEGESPVGGRWSFDEDNRKKLPKAHPVPATMLPREDPTGDQDRDGRDACVQEAIGWVRDRFPDAPGDPAGFGWPTSHEEAEAGLEDFLAHRFVEFGPYEDTVSAEHPFIFHSVLTPGLNIGLLDPRHVLSRALAVGESEEVPMASLEGFVRQLIGWREYMRATYLRWGRRMRSRNRLEHGRDLAPGWWTAETGLEPVDLVLRRVLERGYAHHIERLMVLGNAQCLLRTHPDAVYEWFMEMFVDAYDWVMVPNCYAMSQFAAGELITTKPYVSGSNYLRKMSDVPRGEWCEDWDALYWTFVRDHLDVFERNPRSAMIARSYAAQDPGRKAAHARRANRWLD